MEDNNNLEKFFRDRFNQRLEPQDWNIPDNEIWDGIASEISKDDKKKRVGILPILIVGASILLGTWLSFDNYQKGKDIASLQQELEQCANQSNHVITSEAIEEKSGSYVTNSHANLPEVSNQSKNTQQNSYFNNKPKINKENHTSRRKEEVATDLMNIESTSIPNSDNETSQIKEETGFLATPLLNGLNFKDLKSLNTPEVFDIPMAIKPIKPVGVKTKGIVFGPVIRYIHWHDKVKGSFDNPLSELLVKEETSPSIALGIALTKTLSDRMIINTGIQYYQRNQTSQYEINLPYSTINEISVGTEFENRFSHSLPTGLGNINTNLVLSRSNNSNVANNENVYLDFSLQNHTKALAIPLTVSYYLNKSRDGFFVQGGLFNEFIIQNEIREVDTESHHTFVKDKSIVVDYNKSQVNKVNVSTILGIGYEKELIKGIGISLSANYGFALNNTFATQNYQHKIDQLGLQMMVVKKIK
jgi:Outer membrane protein beta-barrel domain